MLLRTIALLLSLLGHGLLLDAIWSRLKEAKLEVLDLGIGQDIELEPQGRILSNVTNIGDAAETIETQQSIASDVRQPPPTPTVAPPDELHGIVDDVEAKQNTEVAALQEQQPAPAQSPVAPPAQLRDVISSEQSTVEQKLAEPDQPPPPEEALEQSVAAASDAPPPTEIRQQARPPVAAQKPASPEALSEQAPVEVDRPLPPEKIERPLAAAEQATVPRPDRITESSVFAAKKSVAPDEFKVPPPPDEVKEPEVANAKQPTHVAPIAEQQPELLELVAQPEQVAIVTEQSSGEEKTGGNADVVGMYLGRVNDRVQQSKVHPRSPRTGTVTLKFTVGPDGALLSRQVATPSGVRALDEAAVAAIDRAAPFPPIPADVSTAPMTFTQTFKFVLR